MVQSAAFLALDVMNLQFSNIALYLNGAPQQIASTQMDNSTNRLKITPASQFVASFDKYELVFNYTGKIVSPFADEFGGLFYTTWVDENGHTQ